MGMGEKLTLFVGQGRVDRGEGGGSCPGKKVETQIIRVGIGGEEVCGRLLWGGGRHGHALVEK
jgi:hypothetical protein